MWKPHTDLRLGIAFLGFLAVVFCPWWVPALCILVLAFWWRAWEALFIGLAMDFVWLPAHAFPLATCIALAAVWLLEPVRTRFLVR